MSDRGDRRRVATSGGVAVLIAGPVALAFRSGGFFDQPRIVAAIVAWALVAVAAVAAADPVPRSRAGRLALGGLALYTAWVALSWGWAPLEGPAQDDLQRTVLYLGALVAAMALLRGRRDQRALEPGIVAGALIVVGYGLSERIAPALLEFDRGISAGGRLEQPITYWNAMGLIAAMGLVMGARLAGDATRSPRVRAFAAVVAAPLGLGLFLAFSRGAFAALAAGLLALLIAAPAREQARAVGLVLVTAAIPSVASIGLDDFRAFDDGMVASEVQGLIMLVVLVVTGLWALAASAWLRTAEAEHRLAVGPRRPGTRAYGAMALAAALVVVIGAFAASSDRPPGSPEFGANTSRLASLDSNRYAYWRVALEAFGDHPVQGTGAAGYRVEFKRERDVRDPAVDAHSLYLETAAELGLVGLALLLMTFAGVGLAARAALAARRGRAAGAVAVLVTWAVHAGIDWDWEMPAVTLPAIVLAGALVGVAEERVTRTRTRPLKG